MRTHTIVPGGFAHLAGLRIVDYDGPVELTEGLVRVPQHAPNNHHEFLIDATGGVIDEILPIEGYLLGDDLSLPLSLVVAMQHQVTIACVVLLVGVFSPQGAPEQIQLVIDQRQARPHSLEHELRV